MSNFDALLDELESIAELRKSEAAEAEDKDEDDDDEDDTADTDGDGDTEGDTDGDGDDEEPFGKSLNVTLPNGEQMQALDATRVIQSLHDQIDASRDETVKVMAGAIDLIKSLSEDVATLKQGLADLSRQGQGRKSVLRVHDKPDTLIKSETPAGIPPRDILAKALKIQKEGRLHAQQVAEIEGYLAIGRAIPDHLASLLID